MHTVRVVAVLVLFAGVTFPSSGGRRRVVGPQPLIELAECAPGRVTPAAGVLDVAVDDASVFFGAGPELLRSAKNGGGPPSTLAFFPGSLVGLITQDAGALYFGTIGPTGVGTVTTVRKDGTGQRTLIDNIMYPTFITNDRDYVYVLSRGTPVKDSFLPDGKVMRVRKDGSEVKTLASDLVGPSALAVSGNDLFFAENDPEYEFGSIKRVSVDGGAVTLVVNDILVSSMAADASGLYYSGVDLRTYSPAIRHVARSGARATLVEPSRGTALRLIGNELYYITFHELTIAIDAVPLAGGPARMVAPVAVVFAGFSFDACSLYYGTAAGVERTAQR